MKDYTTLSLPQILDEAHSIAADAVSLFGSLNQYQINWKPTESQWSVGQCLEHLILINRPYFPQFHEIQTGQKKTTFWQRMPLLPTLYGKMMIKSLSPGATRKFKAPPPAGPSMSSIDPQIVKRFEEHQREVIAIMKSMETRDPARIIITSPFAKAITYSLLDAFRLMVAHERRHFAQAQRVMQSEGFPGKS